MIVAYKVGISVPAYSKIESGSTDVNLSRLEQIAHVLGVNVVGLLSEVNELIAPTNSVPLKLLAERDFQVNALQRKIVELREELNIKY